MKALFFSDVHGNIEAVTAFCDSIIGKEFDRIVFCGDAVGYGYHMNEVCEALNKLNVDFIRGNHDQNMIDIIDGKILEKDAVRKYGASYQNLESILTRETVDYIRNSIKKIELADNGTRILAIHGSIDDYLNGRVYPDSIIPAEWGNKGFDFIVEGHTHFRMSRKAGNTLIVNPGSIGQPRDGRLPSYVIIDTEKKSIFFYEFNYSKDNIIREIKAKESQDMAERMIDIWKRGQL